MRLFSAILERVFMGSITEGKKKLQQKHTLHLITGKPLLFCENAYQALPKPLVQVAGACHRCLAYD